MTALYAWLAHAQVACGILTHMQPRFPFMKLGASPGKHADGEGCSTLLPALIHQRFASCLIQACCINSLAKAEFKPSTYPKE